MVEASFRPPSCWPLKSLVPFLIWAPRRLRLVGGRLLMILQIGDRADGQLRLL